ncbi:MAG: peptidylprolyl isomerase [Oscillospiraceae bacterium]|nr:peptidylprolyl isomerase [Oscillospiraceae bacterium]MBR3535204.1 peptidylprolyl isomerase [Oscillospiraceae bacterium]MBR6837040.1 peptidylprolyl isomerase [Oscillospiraceae bacterium]
MKRKYLKLFIAGLIALNQTGLPLPLNNSCGTALSQTNVVANASETDLKTGDLDGNDKIDITDLTKLSIYLVGDKELTDDQLKAADVTGDGNVDLADLAHFKQFLAKKTDRLGKNDNAVNYKTDFIITLYPEYAPITCANFEKLVSEGFYNNLTFHRVVDNFCAQGGDPSGDGTGGSPDSIKGEFSSNGVENNLSHKRGVVSMARNYRIPDSATSQFFICYTDDCTYLDGQYAAFGEVTEGMEVIDAFLTVPRDLNAIKEVAVPKTPITIKEAKMIDSDENGHPRIMFSMYDFLSDTNQEQNP